MAAKKGVVFPPIENIQAFKQVLRLSLAKFADNHTVKKAHEEIHELMTEHITNTDRMNAFWLQLSTESSHQENKMPHKKEIIKVYAAASEIFEEALQPFLQKLIASLLKKVKEGDAGLHVVVSDSVGALIQHVLASLELDEQVIEVDAALK